MSSNKLINRIFFPKCGFTIAVATPLNSAIAPEKVKERIPNSIVVKFLKKPICQKVLTNVIHIDSETRIWII